MGKKAKLKQIRRIANQMPVIKISAVIGTKITGKDLIMEGVAKVEGRAVNKDAAYKKRR